MLSKREKEVLRWIAEGKTAWEISVILNISERTVSFHTSNILAKLNAVNKTHAVALAVSESILTYGETKCFDASCENRNCNKML